MRGLTSATGDDVDPTNEAGFGSYRAAIGHMTVRQSAMFTALDFPSLFIYAKTLDEAEHYLELARTMTGELQGRKVHAGTRGAL